MLSYPNLTTKLGETHVNQGHRSVRVLLQRAKQKLSHPVMVLAALEAIAMCPRCRIMKSHNDVNFQDKFTPSTAPFPFSQCGMDHTGPIYHSGVHAMLCTAVQYSTSLGAVFLTPTPVTATANQFVTYIHNKNGPFKKTIVDNGKAFSSQDFTHLANKNGTKVLIK